MRLDRKVRARPRHPRAVPPAARGRLTSSGLHAPGTSSRTHGNLAAPRRARLGRGKRSGAPMRRNPSIFFWTVRLKPHDRNRLHARATQCRTPKGSACSRTLRRPALPLDQTVQKKKFRDRQGQGGAATPSHTSRRNSPAETRTSQHVRPISGRTPVKRTKHKRQERKKCATTS